MTERVSIIVACRSSVDRAAARDRRGLTILELLVTSSILTTLMALLLPAIGATREAARRVQCTNRLRQIGVALHNYHDTHASLPAAWRPAPSRRSAYGWGTAILPWLEQPSLSSDLNQGGELCEPILQSARETSLAVFQCPSDPSPRLFAVPETRTGTDLFLVAAANYAGVYGVEEPDDVHPTPAGDGAFINERAVRFAEFDNGLSNTILVGERSVAMFPTTWIGFDRRDIDAECRVVGAAIVGPNCRACDECEFSSRHPGMTAFLFGDGHVRGLPDGIDQAAYQQMARRAR